MEIVAGALPSLLPKLADLLVGEYNLQKEAKGGIIFLQAELESMKVALEKISETPADKLDKQDKIWARDVRELSYDIEDKIDNFMVRYKAGSKSEQHGFKKAIDMSLEWLTRPKIRRKMSLDVTDMKSRVLEVHERRCRYEVNNHTVDKPVKVDPRALVRYEEATKLVGVDEARDEVIKILMQGNEVSKQQQDKIISIVGFGGLGKTTLANLVYENLKGEFDCSAFVSVSQTPDMEKLFNSLLYQVDQRNNLSIDVIVDDLRKTLKEKRYFIVIDDIWDISVWEHIRCALPRNNGCKIITTTRILRVAEEVGGAYKMKPLGLYSSRILLYGRIFGQEGKDKCPDEDLVEVSDKILTKCAGVPLAIITVAALLASKKRNKLDWYEVYNSIGTGMENNTDVENLRNVLSISYYNLPSHLKTCLLHLSMFPEDSIIDKRRLIWMWIAEGFIVQCGKQGHELFEVGESYFNEIINRSLIQPIYGSLEIHSCRVHDMVLDLIRSLSSAENFITTLDYMGDTSPSQKVRRLSIQNDKVTHAKDVATMTMEQLRSLVVFSSAANLIPTLPSLFGVLRVLCLDNCDLSNGYNNLVHIGKLVHLRYMGLRGTKIASLPEEIGKLQFLQVLDISDNKISTLPFSSVQLPQLKCLYIGLNCSITPNMIRGLTSLEELSQLFIGDSIAIEDVEALGQLTELRVLEIFCFFFKPVKREYMLAECLNKLENIQNLSLRFEVWSSDLDGWVGPHESLCSLKLGGPSIQKLPGWIKHSHVPNLSFLQMRLNEVDQEDLEIIGRLPALRDLVMNFNGSCYDDLREFVIGPCLFPCLERCQLEANHDRVVFQQGAMPRLKSLDLRVPMKVWSAWTEFPDLGFENLPLLQDLHLRLGRSQHGCSDVVNTALRNMAEIHPNHPSVSATGGDGYYDD